MTGPTSVGVTSSWSRRFHPTPRIAAEARTPDVVKGAKRTQRGSSRASSMSPVPSGWRRGPALPHGTAFPVPPGLRWSSSARRAAASAAGSESSERPLPRSWLPVPMSTFASPSSRCSGDAVTSTLRTRSAGVATVLRCRRPVRSCTCSGVMRYRVVAQRSTLNAMTPTTATGPNHQYCPLPTERPATTRPTRAGMARASSRTGWTSSIRGLRRRQSCSLAVAPVALTSRRPGYGWSPR